MTKTQNPAPEEALRRARLLHDRFFTRTDVVAAFMSWGRPHPVEGGDLLPALLLAHVRGQAAPKAVARYTSRGRSTKVSSGWFRVGTYAPDAEGNTRWLCVDFDGANHSDGLIDPDAALLAAWRACTALGVPSHIERSGGGRGWHLWVLFTEPVPAADARRLAWAILPADLPLVSGRRADPRVNRGIEVFPKQDHIDAKGFGSFVWLPLWSEAPEGANRFYRAGEDDALAPFVPDTLDPVDPATLAHALRSLPPGPDTTADSPAPSRRASGRAVADPGAVQALLSTIDQDATDPPGEPSPAAASLDWAAWRRRALAALPLESVYGPWLTGARNGEHWLECRDPDSPSGDRDPSAGVADGTGEAARGTFHSFRTQTKLSVFDFLQARGLATDFRDAARNVAELSGVPLPTTPPRGGKAPARARATASARTAHAGYPVIIVNGRQLRDIISDARDVVNAANARRPFLFQRSSQLVRLLSADGTPHLDTLDETAMYGVLARVADWTRRSQEGDFDVMPPHDVARDLVANLDPSLPRLDAVVTAPVFDAGGALVASPGFHRGAALWYHEPAGFHVGPVPDAPNDAEVASARALLLDDLLVDFPFAGPSDRAHALAAILLPFIRRMVPGSTPIHLIEAPTPGTGKTLLADAVTRIATGHPAEPTTLGRDDEETRKKITSVLSLGKPVLLIDNVRAGIDSATLAATLTAETWQDRILGQSKMILLPNRAVWLVTANNPDLSLEIARRSVRIRIEPSHDRPWERGGFKHSPLTRWIDAQRAELVHAVLVLVRAWQAAGSPPGRRTLGSFEAWAEVLGGILEVAGVPGFLENSEELYEAADREGQEWREFVQAWWEEYADEPQAAKTLLGLAREKEMLGTVLGEKSDRSQAIRLGKALAAHRNRCFGAMQIRAGGPRDHQNRWLLVCGEAPGATTRPVQVGLPLPGARADEDADGMFGMCQDNIPPHIPSENTFDFSGDRDVRDVRDVSPTPPHVIPYAHSARSAHGSAPIESPENIPHIPHIPPGPDSIEETRRDVGRDVRITHPAHPSGAAATQAFADLSIFTEEE